MKIFRLFLSMLCLALASPFAQAQAIHIQDALGREVTLPEPAKRVVITQARHFPVMALLHPNPADILIGWSDEFRTSFSNEYQQYVQQFPALADVAVVARHTADSFSIEQTLALRPDLVVLTASFAGLTPGQNPEDSALLQRLKAANVPVIVIDFFVEPMKNTVPSIKALGYALGQTERTDEFIQFYQEHMDRVAQRLADTDPAQRPPVFIHAHAGSTDCCNSPGTGTFNDMISFAGGQNIGAKVIKNATGKLNFEYIHAQRPHVYVATGTGSGKRTQAGLHIGTDTTPEQARASLMSIIQANRLQALPAVLNGNSHGIWHAFNDSPLHMIFIEALASWIHPELFQDVSPQATIDEVNQRFLTVPLRGTFITDLNAQPAQP